MVLKVSLNTGINRIRLEFKRRSNIDAGGEQKAGINRIRLEFKTVSLNRATARRPVLIESDWNLKQRRNVLRSWKKNVLIESDWNLKTMIKNMEYLRKIRY